MKNTYSFDTYCDLIKQDAINEIIKHRRHIVEPISWIKLQQGGQGGIAVSHITLNHGDNEGLDEQSFELYAENHFPTDIETIGEEGDDILLEFVKDIELNDDIIKELIIEWELPDVIFSGELWKCGHDIKAKLIQMGFKVTNDCIVCYGNEDNTWGWKADGYKEKDVIEYLDPKDLIEYNIHTLEKFSVFFYDKIENRKWFMSKAIKKNTQVLHK